MYKTNHESKHENVHIVSDFSLGDKPFQKKKREKLFALRKEEYKAKQGTSVPYPHCH